jgi:hypothetical protein
MSQSSTNGRNQERWQDLCEQASKEQDSEKLHQLIKEVNDLLETKQRLNRKPFDK